ncbi:PREDICTED: DNA repair endonuclease XPF isoform X1 [Nicrophorus vespilloides]|uniref:DNA repair endonuclease XPF isoform X1 n=2 Tax=Nicrophorus vespilloides TaxID=110193 RepID=A0ABM1MDC1_NICVS|nr:PREDICTED: DNA repair endonuclease XPF isoform X1 [Nicrophorus vespilloides]
MRTIFVKELYIWPRFHSSVIQSLKKHEPQVIELHIPISEKMSKIQTNLLDLMNLSVKELKRINRTLELQQITVENCLVKNFHKVLQSQLDCIWNQLSSKSKQLIADLKILRHLLISLFYSDPVSFYTTLMTYRTLEYAQTSLWVLMEPANQLFANAAALVFNTKKELKPEYCPKWKSLMEILKVEIPNEIKTLSGDENTNVLILCQDAKTCYQLNQFLTQGANHYLLLMALQKELKFTAVSTEYQDCELSQTLSQSVSSKESKKSKLNNSEVEELESMKDSYILSLTSNFLSEDIEDAAEDNDVTFEPFPEMENMNFTQLLEGKKKAPTILIQTFKHSDNFLSLLRTLDEIKPNFIIMYHSNITAIRQIELYEARRQKKSSLKVYFLIHGETVEEQSYLTSLRREKKAFEYLIETKSTMVVPEDQDGKTDQCLALQRDVKEAEVNTRKGGATETPEVKKVVIVDMREFRSELPALIHKRGMEIEPLTITVGDYILTKDICVERKSLSDLVGSLNSGRLYTQCTQMSRYYTRPMLLIEFDQNKQFSWQSNYMISSDENSFEIQQKLLLLTLHFPKLKIIWSPSPYASAQLFEELKEGKDQPDIEYANAIGSEQDVDVIETKYNTSIYDFVQKLPGITSKNIDIFLRRYKNMSEASKATKEELKDVLGNSADVDLFYSILHESHQIPVAQDQMKTKGKLKNKFKFCKK